MAPTEELFAAPNHPYTQALLAEVPRWTASAARLCRSRARSRRRSHPPTRMSLPSALSARDAEMLGRSTATARNRTGTAVGLPSERLLNLSESLSVLRSEICLLHGPARPRVALVLDSPHSGVEFPPTSTPPCPNSTCVTARTASSTSFTSRPTEDGICRCSPRAIRAPTSIPNRHRGDIDLALIEGGSWPHEYVPERQGAHRQGADLAHARRRPPDLSDASCASTK